MQKIAAAFSALTIAVAVANFAQAQGVTRGAVEGAESGGRIGGAPGTAVGGAVGGVVGGVAGLLGVDLHPRFREYVIRRHVASYDLDQPVAVGVVLPEDVVLYQVPPQFHVRRYRYAVVDDRPVLADPHSRVIVQVID